MQTFFNVHCETFCHIERLQGPSSKAGSSTKVLAPNTVHPYVSTQRDTGPPDTVHPYPSTQRDIAPQILYILIYRHRGTLPPDTVHPYPSTQRDTGPPKYCTSLSIDTEGHWPLLQILYFLIRRHRGTLTPRNTVHLYLSTPRDTGPPPFHKIACFNIFT